MLLFSAAALERAVLGELADIGAMVFTLEGRGLVDRQAFFRAALRGWPMGDALAAPQVDWCRPENWNWDGFADFLWQGIYDQPPGPLAFVWRDASDLAEADRAAFDEASDVLALMQDGLSPPPQGASVPHVVFVLFGEGRGFQHDAGALERLRRWMEPDERGNP